MDPRTPPLPPELKSERVQRFLERNDRWQLTAGGGAARARYRFGRPGASLAFLEGVARLFREEELDPALRLDLGGDVEIDLPLPTDPEAADTFPLLAATIDRLAIRHGSSAR